MVLSLSKTNSELSILGKTLTEIKRDAQSGQSILNSLFSNLAYKDGITSDDVSRIKLFISEWNNGVPAVTAWKNSMQGATVAGKQACVQVAKGSLDIGKLTASAGKAGKVIGTLKNVLINFGATLLATLVVEGLIKLFDYLITTSGELKEAMDTAFSSFKNAQQNTETIRSELEQINGQIETLNAKGGLTIIEQDQLDKLREAKRLAEMELSIAEHEERRAAIEAGNKALEYYKSEYGGYSALNDQSVQSALDSSSDDSLWWMDSKNLPTQVAYFKSMTEEVKAEGNALKEHLGKTYDEIYNEILDRKVQATGQKDPSNIWFLQLEAAKEAKALWAEIENYEADKTNLSTVENELRNTYSHLFSIYSDLKTLPEDQLKSLYGDDLEAFNQIANDVDYLFKLFDSAKWSQLKLDEIFDDEKFLKAKDALVELAKAQNGITDVDLSKSGIDLEQWQAALDTINAKYGTNFGLGNIVSQINSEANTINFDELQRQAEEKVSEEISTIEVDTEIKPKFSLEEFSQWYTKLSPEEQKALSTIQLTPNFKFTDHSLEELYTLIQNQIKASKPEPLDFTSFVQGSDMESLDAELSKIEKLKEAMQAVYSGEFDNAALIELTKEFPEAISNTGNMMEFLQGQIGKIIGKTDNLATEAYDADGIIADFDQAIKDAGDNEETVAQLMTLRDVILEIAYEAANMPAINIEVEKSSLDALKTALDEARSAAGLTQESVEALQNRYKGLVGFNPLELFESTNTGLYLNNGVLADLEEAYEKNKFEKIGNQLAYLKEQLVYAGSGAEHDFILEQITKLELLEAQYVGLTSEYNKWTQAQASANDRDMYESVTGGKESVGKLIEQGWAKSDDVTSYLKLLTGKEIDDLTAQQIKELYESLDENIQGTKFSIFDFFTTDKDGNVTSDGVANFFDAVKQKLEGTELGESVLQEDGTFNFLGDNMQNVADELGISVELMEILLRAAQEAGAKVEFNSMFTGLDEGATKIDAIKKKLDELNKTYVEIDIYTNKENIDSEIDKVAQEYQKALQSGDKDLQEYYGAAIDTLVARKNYKNFMGVDTSQLEGDMKKGMDLLQKWQTAKNKAEAASEKGDEAGQAEANQEVVDLVDQINQLPEEIKTKLGFEGDEDATSFLDKIEQGTVEVDIQAILSEANKSDIQMLYEMNGQTLSVNMNVEGNAKETVDQINALPESKTITIDAKIGEGFEKIRTVVSGMDKVTKTITIDAEPGQGITDIETDLQSIGTNVPAVQINVNLDSTSKTQTTNDINAIGSDKTPVSIGVKLDGTQTTVAASINNIGANAQPANITVTLDSITQSAVVADINAIGANAQPANIIVSVNKSQLTQLDTEVSQQRTANVVTIVYDGQLNALDKETSTGYNTSVTVNVLRSQFDDLKTETQTGFNTTIGVKLDPEDPLGEIKQYAGQRDSNTNPNGTPKYTGGVISNPAGVGSSGYGLGSQVTFENPLDEVEDKEANLELNVEGQEDVDLAIESVDTLQDHQYEVKADTFGQDKLDKMKEAHKEITDISTKVVAEVEGEQDTLDLNTAINEFPSGAHNADVTANVSGLAEVEAMAEALEKIAQNANINVNVSGSASVGGSAFKKSGGSNTNRPTNSSRAIGTAYARGYWGTQNSGKALVGELGQEILVRDGHFYTVGDTSAEVIKYKKGDIIFNHVQSKEILEHGRILHGQKRAHTFGVGTAFATGNAFAGSTAHGGSASTDDLLRNPTTKKSSSSNGSSKKSSSKSSKDKEEWFDWIEIAIDRIERAIDNLELKATSVFKTWGSRTSNLRKQMSKVTEEIKLQKKAYDRYLQEANNVGLDPHYAKLVRDGAIDIEKIKDEGLIEDIKQYQEWYEKALDCAYAVDELNESLAELYQQNFENVVTKYEGMLSIIEHEKSLLEESISRAEEQGYIASIKYYEALMERERKNISKLEQQRIDMQKALADAVASGTIAEYSEAWYEMQSQINDVTLSIEEANTAMIEYNNSIRDIEWEIFDLMQEKIGHVVEETEFLVNLLSSDKLHEDGGQLTEEGMATMGLHGMAYNTHMEQAKRYAQELKEIEQDIANDPHNQKLLERRQELLEAQRDSILAAEDEREAIVNLVQEGIDLELEALEERIDKYNESLKSAKDLYEYQKRIKEQTQEIAVLEKQMMAYQGDDSEETKAKIQQIKVDLESARDELEETEYDHYIEDTEKMLDDLLTEYEELLNMRLDDVDALISDMIDRINQNSDTINDTLHSLAAEFGYEVSDIMKNTWMNDGQVVTVYDNDIMNSITNAATSLSNELQSIDDGIWQMVATFNEAATSDTENIHANTRGYASGAYRISKNQLAWTQEGRNLEAIIRPSDGAILTPLAKNDSVLNANATANLFDFANNPSQFIKDNLDIGHVTDVQPHQIVGNTYDNDFSIQIALPNVSNYEQFKRELQQDKSFERMIKAMTTDRLFGGSSINKYKY